MDEYTNGDQLERYTFTDRWIRCIYIGPDRLTDGELYTGHHVVLDTEPGHSIGSYVTVTSAALRREGSAS